MKRREFLTCLGVAPFASLIPATVVAPANPFADPTAFADLIGYPLFPVQRFVVKMLYGLPLSAAELRYQKRLEREGRCFIPKGPRRELVAVMGRRSGMTHIGSLVGLFEANRLLNGAHSDLHTAIMHVSPNREMADHVRGGFRSYADRLWGKTSSRIGTTFVTNHEGRKVQLLHKSAVSVGLRGIRTPMAVLDCADCFQDFPLLNSVVNGAICTDDGRKAILTPVSKGPSEFKEYYEKAKSHAVVLRIPSWEANPTITHKTLREIREWSGDAFEYEYGAKV